MDPISAPASPPPADPPPGPRGPGRDPHAAGLANASLLGIGYAMLGRWPLAVGNAIVSVVLVGILASGAHAAWFRTAVLLWWLAVTAHGWYLARGWPRRPDRPARQRLVALGVALPAVLAFAVLRADASGIEDDAAEAHREGDCARALSILDGLWAGHEVADGRLVERADESVEACALLMEAEREAGEDRLEAASTLARYADHPGALWDGAQGRRADLFLAEATHQLDTAIESGSVQSLSLGFEHLSTVLGEFPGREGEVEQVMDGFLGGLPADGACDTKQITDWLGDRPASGDALDRAADVVPEIAPAAIVECGDEALADDSWTLAIERYEQLLDQYPGHALADAAAEGVNQAETEIELDHLRDLVRTGTYCDDPAPYRGADPYRGDATNPALIYGEPGAHTRHLPDSWLADDAQDAVLVICVGDLKEGTSVATCSYESEAAVFGYTDVTFHNRRFPVEVYEVRTGEVIDDTRIEIGGTSCPDVLEYEYYSVDLGPPSDTYVDSSPSDVRAAYESLIDP
ncbi:hypothetical protein [Streptomyces sp. 6N223]|uniref:hypothetical protein n=1 Tax=Streptomyces sp. 6N223 TaxID=3457412 RepID=UPI003FD0DE24